MDFKTSLILSASLITPSGVDKDTFPALLNL